MTRIVPLSIAFLLALAAAAGLVYGLSTGSVDRDANPRPPAATAVSSTPAAQPSPAAERKPGARAGRLTLDDAFRELDLIRPSRAKPADDFTVTMADGASFRLSQHRGKTVLVNFWATWCPPCREEMPALERLHRRHKDRGLVLVAISLDTDPKVVPPYVKASGLTFPIALDPKAEVANTYGVRALPSSFVIDRQGMMTGLALGPRVWDNEASHALVEALTR
jgi:peroxiredoxin